MRRFSWFNATALTLGFAFLYIPMIIFVITATSNAVNLTDGLDGLAIGTIITFRSEMKFLNVSENASPMIDPMPRDWLPEGLLASVMKYLPQVRGRFRFWISGVLVQRPKPSAAGC